MNHYANHVLVTGLGLGLTAIGLAPVLFPNHLRSFIDSNSAATLLVGLIGGVAGIIACVILVMSWGRRMVLCMLAGTLTIVVVYLPRLDPTKAMQHEATTAIICTLLMFIIAGGIALTMIGIREESVT